MALKNTSSSSGNWTREADLADAVAVLIEPKRYERDVPNEKFGTTRNILDANLTIFDKAAIDGGKPDVIKNALLTGAGTTRQYDEESIGEAFVAKFVLTPSKRGKDFYPPPWCRRRDLRQGQRLHGAA